MKALLACFVISMLCLPKALHATPSLCLTSQLNTQSQQEINAEKTFLNLTVGQDYVLSFEVTSITPAVNAIVDDGNSIQNISIVQSGFYAFNLNAANTSIVLALQSLSGKKQPTAICIDDLLLQAVSQKIVTSAYKEPINDYRYAFNGIEKDDEVKLGIGNSYAYSARMYDPRLGQWLSIDPKFNQREGLSPYNFVQNNPLARVDPTGELDGWYKDANDKIQYDPNVGGQGDLGECQQFLGCSFQETSNSGNKISYMDDGSIFFESETDAYNRMWEYALTNDREQMGIIFSDGVLVLPEYLNLPSRSKIVEYDYDFEEKDDEVFLTDRFNSFDAPIIGTIHTHQNPGISGFSHADVNTFTSYTPNVLFFILEDDLIEGNRTRTVYAGVGNDLHFQHVKMDEAFSRQNLLSGKVGLIPTLLDLRKK